MYIYFVCTCILYVYIFCMYMYFVCTCILYVLVFCMYIYFVCTYILYVHMFCMNMYFECTCIFRLDRMIQDIVYKLLPDIADGKLRHTVYVDNKAGMISIDSSASKV